MSGSEDAYTATFEHGTVAFGVGPLTQDGKIEQFDFAVL